MLQTCHSARMLPIFWLLRRNKPLQFFKKEKLHMRVEAAISCTWVVITLLQHVKTCTKSRHTRYFQRALTFISWFIDGVQRDAVMCLVAGMVSGYYHTNPSLPSSFDRFFAKCTAISTTKLHRQEPLKSVGGRKSMCQIQATAGMEQRQMR
jgi:hypothetical protein